MTPNPIRKVLLTLRSQHVQFLLMGGQACVFYGAAEFSRDTDIVLLSNAKNLKKLSLALKELKADCIAVPSFSAEYLQRGHAVHFRCHHPDAMGMRIDVMSVLRGVRLFPELWKDRTTIEIKSGEKYDLLSLPDLVQAKKTRRDKDWLMIRRLIEANYFKYHKKPVDEQIVFWLKECRTPSLLIELARVYPGHLDNVIKQRSLLKYAKTSDEMSLSGAIHKEEQYEREADQAYWQPLIRELEKLRHRKCE